MPCPAASSCSAWPPWPGRPRGRLAAAGRGVAQGQPGRPVRPTSRPGAAAAGFFGCCGGKAPPSSTRTSTTGQKDTDGSRLFYETLADWDNEGRLIPQLAAEIPSLDNGGVARGRQERGLEAEEGRAVARRRALSPPMTWSSPGATPATPPRPPRASPTTWTARSRRSTATPCASSSSSPRPSGPTPSWARAARSCRDTCSAPYTGAKSREAPANLAPVGTGPYKFVAFKPGDLVQGVLNPNYHLPNRPHFDRIEMKGGGDAVSAARAVLQTGEYDFAWNIQVEGRTHQAHGSGRQRAAPISSLAVPTWSSSPSTSATRTARSRANAAA